MFDEKEGQTNYCQQCEELQAQIVRLRESAKEMLSAERYSSRPPETVIEAERKLDRIRKAAHAVDQALSDTADNDKWLAEIKMKMLSNIHAKLEDFTFKKYTRPTGECMTERHGALILIAQIKSMEAELRNQAKKG